MLISEILKIVEEIAPLNMAASWDKSGMQVASSKQNISHLAVCLDPLAGQLRKAVDLGADFIISHHPLSLDPSLPCKIDEYWEALAVLFGAKAGLYTAHTSLDVNLAGPSGWLARDLKLKNLKPLERIADNGLYGYGLAGQLEEPTAGKELLAKILGFMNLREAVLWGPSLPDEIEKIAFCGGSGASLLDMASNAEAQLYITGDVKYHFGLTAPIPVADVGHHALEEEMMKRFAKLLQEKMPDLPISFLPSASPFRYFSL